MRHIIHDWDDEQSLTILQNIHRTEQTHPQLLLVEWVIQPGNNPDFAKLLDLTMLVITGGQERTEDQYRRLLFTIKLRQIVPTAAGVSVLESTKVG